VSGLWGEFKKDVRFHLTRHLGMTDKVLGSFTALTDEELLEHIRLGHKLAYNVIVERYLAKLWRLGMSVFHNESEAEDAVQDVFLSLWQNRERWKNAEQAGAKFSTWIYRVMLNRCIDIKRKRKPQVGSEVIDDFICDTAQNAESLLAETQKSVALLSHLMGLPEKQRMALVLFYYEELSVRDISDKLNTTEQAVRSLLKRGRNSLRERFENESDFKTGEFQELS